MTEEVKRTRSPEMTKVRLLRGYVPSHIPEHILKTIPKASLEDGLLPKAAPGSVIEVPGDEARDIVRKRIAEVAFSDDNLEWTTPAEKKAREDAEQRQALQELQARIYSEKLAQIELSKRQSHG